MKFAELKKKLMSGDINSMYYFTGSDEYLKSWSIKLLKSKITMPEINCSMYESIDGKTLEQELLAMPMMSDFKLDRKSVV